MTTIASLRRDYLAGNRDLESSIRSFESSIRGALDATGVNNRKQGRSKYGAKRGKKAAESAAS